MKKRSPNCSTAATGPRHARLIYAPTSPRAAACSDLVLVTQSFQAARAAAVSPPQLQSPGALWWRAQLHRRNAAVERIGKPILGAQVFALAVTLFAAAAFLAFQATHGLRWMALLEDLPHSLNLAALWPTAFPSVGSGLMLLVPILATVALVSGVVVYLASEKR